MRGDTKVIAELNQALSAELSAIVQYMVQSEMCENWGYDKLAGVVRQRAFQEMRHAEGLIERILYLDGEPNVSVALQPVIGSNVEAQIKAGLKDESEAVGMYNNSIKICVDAGDNGTRELFLSMVKDEEAHVEWLEAQLQQIQDTGIANYLAQQTKPGE